MADSTPKGGTGKLRVNSARGISNLELAELAMNSLRYRSLRSWLAILGIVIGVASIISLISISNGMNENVQKSLGGSGANLITLSAGGRARHADFWRGCAAGAVWGARRQRQRQAHNFQ